MNDNERKRRKNDLIVIIILVVLLFPTIASWWADKAQLPLTSDNFWSDDIISSFFERITNGVLIPIWNTLAANDALRAIIAILIVGFIGGLGSDLYKSYMGNKKEDD